MKRLYNNSSKLLWLSLLFFATCTPTEKVVKTESTPTVPYEQKIEENGIPGTPVKFSMSLVPSGSYMMGSSAKEKLRDEDEGPQVKVQVESFWIGVHELTFDEYNVFREKELDLPPPNQPEWDADAFARPSPPYEDPTFGMGKSGFPAVSMTQFAALQYCRWLSQKTGEFYRLPTEAEWEYACRAGTTTTYYFGDDEKLLDEHAWHFDNSDEKYHKVGSKKANPWGLYDMLGNVSEWTLDQYKADAYTTITNEMKGKVNPWIKPTSLYPRTVRGGSWDDDKEDHRCASRISSIPKWKERDPQIPKSFWWNTDSPFVGFRLVKPAQQPSAEEQAAFWALVLGD